ncbi:cation:proton antiporter domain-containing protein [Halocatena pleomorpha]|uniref:Sodium:proton exchanger n=1 Tax=Halocatena pleomorpha TaxID=1785090 RepID=A0A3P3REY0_9EURY|nr:cation:proton antiporter [Halocatena pleomorpha]RRJ31489.1 sodium:proton exchanger [Halocatena pleomorpha]
MQELNIFLVTVGGLTLVLSLIAGLMQNKAYLPSEPMAAVALGILIGPAGMGFARLTTWGAPLPIIEQAARLTVGLAVMAAALRLPRGYFQNHARSMSVVLLPGMIGMWLVSSGLVYVLLSVPFTVAFLIGAIITPTDPVLAGTIVMGHTAQRSIPAPIRNLLTGESGANDGLAYPFVFLPILLFEHVPERAFLNWIVETLLWEVGAAVVIGAAAGALAGWIEQVSHEYHYLEESSLLSVTVALTFTVLGGVKLVGSNGILAAFAAGLLFNRLSNAGDEADEQKVQETVLRLFTFPIFVIFGIVLPVDQWIALGWAGVVLPAGVLLVRRLPMVGVFRTSVPAISDDYDALFAGWFGPIGIAALFYATVAHRIIGEEIIWSAATLVVTSSILVHGVTATLFTKLYGRIVDPNRIQTPDDDRQSSLDEH